VNAIFYRWYKGEHDNVGIEGVRLDGDPYWTKTGSWTMGLDPLGLQATSIRIYQSLVPNVTNITNRLRYYAYFPWLVELYEKLHHSDNPARFATFMRRGEALYALATVVNGPDGSDGLGGANWANQQREAALSHGIDFKPFTDDRTSEKTYLQAPRGNYGAAYAPTLIEMGWLTASSVPVTQGHGELVAAAFAGSIGAIANEIEAVLLSGTATSKQLQDIGAAVHPAQIPQGSKEQAALRDFLLAGCAAAAGRDGAVRRRLPGRCGIRVVVLRRAGPVRACGTEDDRCDDQDRGADADREETAHAASLHRPALVEVPKSALILVHGVSLGTCCVPGKRLPDDVVRWREWWARQGSNL